MAVIGNIWSNIVMDGLWCNISITQHLVLALMDICYHNNIMMVLLHGDVFQITDPLWGESTGDQWIPLTKGQ